MIHTHRKEKRAKVCFYLPKRDWITEAFSREEAQSLLVLTKFGFALIFFSKVFSSSSSFLTKKITFSSQIEKGEKEEERTEGGLRARKLAQSHRINVSLLSLSSLILSLIFTASKVVGFEAGRYVLLFRNKALGAEGDPN